MASITESRAAHLTTPDAAAVDASLIDGDDELLVEEISIDGMCGVY